VFYVRQSVNGLLYARNWGMAGDLPLASIYVR